MAAVDISSRYEDLCRLCAMKTAVLLSVNIFAQEGALRQVDKKIESCLQFQVMQRLCVLVNLISRFVILR